MTRGGNILRLTRAALLGLILVVPALLPQAHAATPHDHEPAVHLAGDDHRETHPDGFTGGCHAGIICTGAILTEHAGTVTGAALALRAGFIAPDERLTATNIGFDPPPPRLS